MDFDEYVAARYGRLIEHAVLVGVAEGEAGTFVDRVLVEQRKQIRRAEDPDPLMYAALDRAIRGEPETRHRFGVVAALASVAVAAVVGIALGWQPDPGSETMPSLFGYDADGATAFLESHGFNVRIEKFRGCEPLGQVIGSVPAPGDKVEKGGTVRVQTALPTDSFCIPNYDDRVDAWSFVRFAIGGKAPDLASIVQLQIEPDARAVTLTGAQAQDRSAWGEALTLLRSAATTPIRSISGMPRLVVDSEVPPRTFCGYTRPAQFHRRTALRFQVDAAVTGAAQCPLTVDLYRRDRVIDGVVVYPASE